MLEHGVRTTGSLTFLFTDIEGSTRRWDSDRAAMSAALARHDALLRSAIESAGGTVFKTVGDAFCAVFDSAADGVAAALAAQRSLGAEDWSAFGADFAPLRVRMALHAGEAEARGGDWFGPPLNRVARLLAAGHGGQVLLSEAIRAQSEGAWPEGVGLRDLGLRRLKDLRQPEQVFQLLAPGLPADFAPLATLDARPNNLPIQPTSLVGREAEVDDLTRKFRAADGPRLVTLTGPGGTGKTRLALAAAAELVDDFPDGVRFVDLSALRDADAVLPAVAEVLGIAEEPGRRTADAIRRHIATASLLLLLDNFEQVVDAATELAELLAAAPALKVLVTSRIPLRLAAEREWPVPPLSLPDPAHPPALDQLRQFEAIRLFVDRATAVSPDFAVTETNAPAVAAICHRLDGLPLAIELAAARVRILSPDALLARLEHRLTLLIGGRRDAPARQQTLAAAIAWSHDLLPVPQRILFRRLAVFAGGASLDAIEQVVPDEPLSSADLLYEVEALVAASLLQVQPYAADFVGSLDGYAVALSQAPSIGQEATDRFGMLETIHEFARDRLEASGEAETVRRRHAEWCLQVAEATEPFNDRGLVNLIPGTTTEPAVDPQALARKTRERLDLSSALEWALRTDEAEIAVRLGVAIGPWLAHPTIVGAYRSFERLVELARGLDSPARLVRSLHGLGKLAVLQGDGLAAERCFQESLTICRADHDVVGISWLLNDIGEALLAQDRWAEAINYLERAIAAKLQLGDVESALYTRAYLGEALRAGGRWSEARRCYELCLEVDDPEDRGGGWSRTNLGWMCWRMGDVVDAARHFSTALGGLSRHDKGARILAMVGAAGIGAIAVSRGDPKPGIRLLSAMQQALRDEKWFNLRLDRRDIDAAITAARATIPTAVWDEAWAQGAILGWDAAMALAKALATAVR